MNSIGFNNFRRFATFPEMDLGDITLLVGGNNSGKSTLVKALLLCIDNARLMTAGANDNILGAMNPKFRFDANEWHDVKIKTFSRAIHNRPAPSFDLLDDELALPTKMRFTFTLGNFKFVVEVAGDRDKDEATGNVTYISIEDRKNMVQYVVNYANHDMSYSVLGTTSERETLEKRLYKEYVDAKDTLETLSLFGDNLAAITEYGEKVSSLEKRIEELVNPNGDELPEDFDYAQALKTQFVQSLESFAATTFGPFPIEDYINESNRNLLVHIIDNFIGFATNPGQARLTVTQDPNQSALDMLMSQYVQEAREALKQDVGKMQNSKMALISLLNSINVEYITAHAANQNTIYNTADRNDYIAQTVHEFVRAKIAKGEEEYLFIQDWMNKFGIGADFEIISIDGEAYRVKIKDEDGYAVNLADKGMGSIQVMILLLRLATILRTYKPKGIAYYLYPNRMLPRIIIEEPEQNLHPKMQSLLADLFFKLSKEYNCRFLIETHSEYLIRKTQVLVGKEKYKDETDLNENNPFKVYYFPSDGPDRYEMLYTLSGRFSNKFGEGFFDEAGKSNLETLRNEKGLK